MTGLLNEAADQLKDPDQSPTARTVGGYKLNAVGIKDVGILLSLKSLLLKNTGFGAIAYDLTFLAIFSLVAMTAATLLFRRSL